MTTFLALTKRELGVYFVSPMAYIILTSLLILSGLAFAGSLETFAETKIPLNYSPTLIWMAWILVITSPLVTMRLVAEEKKNGTLEIVLTAPVTELQFVLAKFASSVLFMLYLLLPTLGYLLIVVRYGQVDLGAVFCGYAGVALAVALSYAIGLFISSLCSNQITAGIISFMVSLILFFASFLAGAISRKSGWREVVDVFNLNSNLLDFFKGVVDVGRLGFILSGIVFFLFLTVRVVESRRWR